LGEFLRDRKSINSFSLPIADVKILKSPITIAMGTDDEQELIPSDDKVLFSFTFLHSYPKINTNGATFAYPLLRKSIGTAVNSPIDYEHKIEGSPVYDGENIIIGAILSAELPELEDTNEIFPTEGQPVTCVGVLWCRITEANKIVKDLKEGKEWRVSMEVTREVETDVFIAGEEIIRQDDLKWDEVFGAWIQRKQYNGEDIGLALGGTGLEENDSANFFGAGIVWNPADEDAEIHDFEIVPMANQINGFNFMAIATKKESDMAKVNKLVIETGGVAGDASLTINGTKVEDFDDIEFWSFKDWGDWGMYWSTKVEAGEEGVKETRSFRFDPATASIIANEKGGNPMMNPKEIFAEISKLLEEKYAKWVSPEDVDTTVATQVAEKLDEVRSEYENHISPDDLDVKIAEAIELRDKNEAVYVARETELTEATIELTKDRKDEIRKFEISEDGDAKFKQWLEDIKVAQTAMETELTEKGIEVTDEVKKTIASMSGTKDSGFIAVVGMLTIAGVVKKEVDIPGNGKDTDTVESNKTQHLH